MSCTLGMAVSFKVYFIFYVTESLHSLCLADVFKFSLTLKSYKVCLEYSSTVQYIAYLLQYRNQCHRFFFFEGKMLIAFH
jgi:hypothetical protein